MQFCSQCGSPNQEGVKFCANCGASLAQAASPAARPSEPPPPSKPAPAKKAGGAVWLWPVVAAVLLIGLIVTGVLFFNKSGALNDSQARVAELENDVIGLEADVSARVNEINTLEQELAAEEARAAGLETELAAEKASLAATQAELATAKGNITQLEAAAVTAQARITSIEADLSASKTRASTLESDLSKANADLATMTNNFSNLTANYNKVIAPRYFNSLTELQTWLAADDTNTRYSTLSFRDMAVILEIRAMRDGLLLSAATDWDAGNIYSWNTTIIGNTIYAVQASTDLVITGPTLINTPVNPPLPLP